MAYLSLSLIRNKMLLWFQIPFLFSSEIMDTKRSLPVSVIICTKSPDCSVSVKQGKKKIPLLNQLINEWKKPKIKPTPSWCPEDHFCIYSTKQDNHF